MTHDLRRTATMLAAAATVAIPLPALAHNGVGAAFKGPAGPYTVYAYDGYPIPAGELEYRLIVLARATGDPVEDVAATVTAHPTTATTPTQRARVTVMANVVLYDLPNPYPRDWRVTVRLHSRLGDGVTSFPMHGAAPYAAANIQVVSSGGPDATVIAGGSAAVLAVTGAVGAWWWRRRRADGRLSRATSARPRGG